MPDCEYGGDKLATVRMEGQVVMKDKCTSCKVHFLMP